jgi:hypothetical protein
LYYYEERNNCPIRQKLLGYHTKVIRLLGKNLVGKREGKKSVGDLDAGGVIILKQKLS